MSSYSINIRVTQELNKHLQQQIGEFGLFGLGRLEFLIGFFYTFALSSKGVP